MFFAAQFTSYFKETNLATFIAVQGANILQNIGLSGIPLTITIVIFVTFMDFSVASASAKWAMLAPVLVPMLAIMGYHPAFAQAAYRVGDSVANGINPVSSYMPLMIGFVQKYKKDAGIGTVMAYGLPYSIFTFITWVVLIILWQVFKLPLGPGANILL